MDISNEVTEITGVRMVAVTIRDPKFPTKGFIVLDNPPKVALAKVLVQLNYYNNTTEALQKIKTDVNGDASHDVMAYPDLPIAFALALGA